MESEGKTGVAFALCAFLFWGLVTPLYFKWASAIPPLEILAHRIVWSLALVGILLYFWRRYAGLRRSLGQRRTLLVLLAAAIFVSLNWITYIWAISSGQAVEAALGYYINPLVNVVLGFVVLRERLNRAQMVAVAIAATGVINLTLQLGSVPWLALTLACTFGIYGLIRKTAPLASMEGLFMETVLLTPFALGYIFFLEIGGQGTVGETGWSGLFLLILSGPVTALPLIWYASGARRLRFSTIGLFQYLAPTCIVLVAVFLFGEPFTTAHLITFACIWTALAIYSFDSLRASRTRRAAAIAAAANQAG
ncbi:EamA family transporter RarD [Limibacillus sp. MBR-115]|jgi:chloramphenicol-sensitive protein RarD|uniref:EamA family transporter RarD n=1 Tax=Limibacillus sp. MBR-115 TaxID=3156465 RepID=UPI003395C038